MGINEVLSKIKGQMQNKANTIILKKGEWKTILKDLIEKTEKDGSETESGSLKEQNSLELLHDFETEQLKINIENLETRLFSELEQHKLEIKRLEEQNKLLLNHVLESDSKKTEAVNQLVNYLEKNHEN